MKTQKTTVKSKLVTLNHSTGGLRAIGVQKPEPKVVFHSFGRATSLKVASVGKHTFARPATMLDRLVKAVLSV